MVLRVGGPPIGKKMVGGGRLVEMEKLCLDQVTQFHIIHKILL